MRVAPTGPLGATAAAAALSAKDAFRVARFGLRRIRNSALPTPESLPTPLRRLVETAENAGEVPIRTLREALSALPFAPKPLPVPCGLALLDARRAQEGGLSRLSIGGAAHEALKAILARLDLDTIVYEAALAEAVVGALDASRGQAPARRGAALAAALARSEGRAAEIGAEDRARWRRGALAFALATVVASEPEAATNGETLQAAADLVDALGEEADAAFRSEADLAAFIAGYAPHV